MLLFRVISFTLNPRIGLFFLVATVMSPGNFHSSTAYLPSSFAMYMSLLGAAAFMNWRGGIRTSWGIWWFAVGGILGWPFASALCAPFLIEEGILAILAALSDSQRLFEAIMRVVRGGVAALLLAVGAPSSPTVLFVCLTKYRSVMRLSTLSSIRRSNSSPGILSSTTYFPRQAVPTSMAQNHGPSIFEILP